MKQVSLSRVIPAAGHAAIQPGWVSWLGLTPLDIVEAGWGIYG
jgi:hypothetical protein